MELYKEYRTVDGKDHKINCNQKNPKPFVPKLNIVAKLITKKFQIIES